MAGATTRCQAATHLEVSKNMRKEKSVTWEEFNLFFLSWKEEAENPESELEKKYSTWKVIPELFLFKPSSSLQK